MQTNIDKSKIQQRYISDLETRLDSYGRAVEEQHECVEYMRWKMYGAYIVAAIAIVCLVAVTYQHAVAPMLSINGVECRL